MEIINFTQPARKLLFFSICLLSSVLSSCSKNDKVQPNLQDKTIRVTIQHEGDIHLYQALLSVNGPLDNEKKKVPVSGVTWDEEVTSGKATIYTKELESLPGEISYKTDRPASGIQFTYSVWVHDYTIAVASTPVTATINYYVNDKLIKTDTYKAEINSNGLSLILSPTPAF